MIERLCRMVATRSVSREEAALADLVAADLGSLGLAVKRQGANVWCEVGDAARPRLLLNSHLDTVPAGEGWTGNPWTPRQVDGRILGLGANDAKGCGAAMIEAVTDVCAALRSGERLGGTVVLALTAEEEISGQGLATILDFLRPLDAAIVGEPTGLTPMIAQRGLLILRITAKGVSGHPANTQPESGNNAVLTAVRDIVALSEFDWGPAHTLLGRCHAHVTMIQGGVARNVVPDRCEFFVDVRTTPMETHAALVNRVRTMLRSEVSVHSDRLVAVETSVDEPIVQAATEAADNCSPAGSPAMSDMVFLAGTPAVKIGPGQSQRSHTPDEFIMVDELREGAAAYGRMIREYFRRCGTTGAAA